MIKTIPEMMEMTTTAEDIGMVTELEVTTTTMKTPSELTTSEPVMDEQTTVEQVVIETMKHEFDEKCNSNNSLEINKNFIVSITRSLFCIF